MREEKEQLKAKRRAEGIEEDQSANILDDERDADILFED